MLKVDCEVLSGCEARNGADADWPGRVWIKGGILRPYFASVSSFLH